MIEEKKLLTDADIVPTDEIIAEGLGKASDSYTKFVKGLKDYDISLMEWRYYNDGKAWLSKGEYKWTTARGANKVKPLFWLSIWEGFFRVAFFFSTEIKEELLALPISKKGKEIVTEAKPMGKTGSYLPVVFDVSEEKQLNDIYQLAKFRKEKI